MPIVTDKGIYPERLDWTYDNRDPGETWLQLEGTGDFISVSPVEVMGNMLENCFNEDVTFLFQQFGHYLDSIDIPGEDTRNDTSTDHIVKFRDFLNCLIETNGS